MTFKVDKIEMFLAKFEASKEKIRNFEGCEYLELFRDSKDSTVFFTLSHWQSEQDLNNYRHSELFKSIWPETKSFFREKAEAWSVYTVE